MTCRELIEFLADYLSGELPGETRELFEQHLAVCRHCRQYLASYRATIAMGQSALRASEAEVPADVPEDLIAAILATRVRS